MFRADFLRFTSKIVEHSRYLLTAEQYLAKDYFVLFYSASTLKDNLEAAIRNDFVWEFHRERGIAHIIDRFDEIARTHGKTLLIILDALDRFPGKPEKLKAELLDLIPRLRGRSLRLCLSCKSFDWPAFIIDDARSFNKLATAIYPLLPQPQTALPPEAHSVGTWLHDYTDAELDQIFSHYQRLFSLQGTLQGTVRQACHDPLLLRLLAEVYSHQNEVLPRTLSQRELFERYWTVQLSKMRHPWEAEQWLTELARISVESRERQVTLTELRPHLSSFAIQQETYDDLLRTNLLTVTTDLSGQSSLSFTLDPFRSYVYALKAQSWTHHIRQGKSRQVASFLCQLLSHPIGVEVVEFYMRTIDQGKTRLLTDIALLDVYHFAQLLEILQGKSFVSATPPGDAHQQAIYDYLTQFISAYTDLSHAYFSSLCDRIEPYKGEIGLWISTSLEKTTYQFRRRTAAKPEPLLILSPMEAQSLWPVPRSQEIRAQVQPYGGVTQTLGDPSLIEHLPQKSAWQRILSQVARLFVTRALDESHTPSLLHERIWHTFLYEPHIFSGGVPVTGQYWQVLSFSTPEEISNTPLEELLKRTQAVIEQYRTQLVNLVTQHGHQGEPPGARWYGIYIQKLQRLRYCLQKLQATQSSLLFPSWNRHQLFEYLRTGDLLPSLAWIRQFFPSILQSYRSLVQSNVAAFADHLALFTHSNASFLIEVIPEPSLPAFHSDFLQITYALLPSSDLPEKYLVYTCQEQDSLMHIPFRQPTLEGHWTETSGRQGASFGQGKIARWVEGRFIDEPNAFFYVTQFPSPYPILDQVYQLLGNELSSLLRGNHRDWFGNPSGKIDDEMLDSLIEFQSRNT